MVAAGFRIGMMNVRMGAFPTYSVEHEYPERLDLIQATVAAMKAEVVCLVDTFRWREIFSAGALGELFDYPFVHQMSLNCEVVDPRIGMTVFATEAVESCESVRIFDRDCLRLRLNVGGRQVVVYFAYLTNLSGVRREMQAVALLERVEAEPEGPVLVMGDLNTLRPADVPQVLGSAARILAKLPGIQRLGTVSQGLQLGYTGIIPLFERAGFRDQFAGNKSPTFRTMILGCELRLRIDYCLSRGLDLADCEIMIDKMTAQASDHHPLVVTL